MIFTDLDWKQQQKSWYWHALWLYFVSYEQPAADQSYISFQSHYSWAKYSRIIMQNLCKTGNLSLCTCMLTHISLWGGTEGPFDSCSGWGCLVRQTPKRGAFSLGLQPLYCFTTAGGRTQASCVWTENRRSHAASSSVSAATDRSCRALFP